MKKVWVIEWEEWDDGWMRPDGISLHINESRMDDFIREESKKGTNKYHDFPTDTYEKKVSDKVYDEVMKNGGSKRYEKEPW